MLTKSCGSSWASCCPSKMFPNAFKFTRIEAHATIANFRTYPWPQLASALLKALVSLPGLESRGRKVWQSRASCNTTLYLVECSKQIRTRYNLHLIRGWVSSLCCSFYRNSKWDNIQPASWQPHEATVVIYSGVKSNPTGSVRNCEKIRNTTGDLK